MENVVLSNRVSVALLRALHIAACVWPAFVSALLAPFSSPACASDQTVTVLTGGTGTPYYPLGEALAVVMRKTAPGMKTSVQATKGSAENLSMLDEGRGEIAFAIGDTLSNAWKGNEDAGFKAPLKNLRGIAALYPNYIQIVARGDSNIHSLADLKGKKISVGPPKSNTELDARAIFKAAGLDYKDFAKVEYAPFGQSVELMKERQIDALVQSADLGGLALRDLATSLSVIVVPMPPDVVKKMNDPTFLPAVIPAGTYRGQTADVPAVAVQNYLVSHDGVADEVVYATAKALWTNLDALTALRSAAKAIDLQRALEGLPVPLHPGAERYYKEVGVLK